MYNGYMRTLAATTVILVLLLFTKSSCHANDTHTEKLHSKGNAGLNDSVDPPLQAQRTPWERWRSNIRQLLRSESDRLMDKTFADAGPLRCDVSFTVTRTSRIKDVKIAMSSQNSEFDSVAKKSALSLSGNKALAFPKGSTQQQVEYQCTIFTNFGREPRMEGNYEPVKNLSQINNWIR